MKCARRFFSFFHVLLGKIAVVVCDTELISGYIYYEL